MQIWSSIAALIGIVLLLLGGLWVGAAAVFLVGDGQSVGMAIALIFQSYGFPILALGLILCALGGIEGAIDRLTAEIRRQRKD